MLITRERLALTISSAIAVTLIPLAIRLIITGTANVPVAPIMVIDLDLINSFFNIV